MESTFFFFLFFGLRTSWCFSWDIGGGNITRRQRQRVCKKEPRGTQYRLVYEKEGGRAKGKGKGRERRCASKRSAVCSIYIHPIDREQDYCFFLAQRKTWGQRAICARKKGSTGQGQKSTKSKRSIKNIKNPPICQGRFPFPCTTKKPKGLLKQLKRVRGMKKKKKKKKRKEKKKKRARFAMHMRRPKTRETLSMNPIRHVFVKSYPKAEEEAPPL